MHKHLGLVASLLLVAGCGPVESSAPAPSGADALPRLLAACIACHGHDGRATAAHIPHLAAQQETYLLQSLQAYRDGRRPGNVMVALVGHLDDAELALLARHYAAQPAIVQAASALSEP